MIVIKKHFMTEYFNWRIGFYLTECDLNEGFSMASADLLVYETEFGQIGKSNASNEVM